MIRNKPEDKPNSNLNKKSQSRKELIKSRYLLIKKIKEEQKLDKIAQMIEDQSR